MMNSVHTLTSTHPVCRYGVILFGLTLYACVEGASLDDNQGTQPENLVDAPNGGNPSLVKLPEYDNFTYVTTVIRDDQLKAVRDVYANSTAINGLSQGILPPQSIVVMETWKPLVDANGNPVLNNSNAFQRGDFVNITVMEKRTGWGVNYTPATRNGEWEYAVYDFDKNALAPDSDCYGCHAEKAGPSKDYVFTINNFSNPTRGNVAPIDGDPIKVKLPQAFNLNDDNWAYVTTIERQDNNQVRDVYANTTALNGAVANTGYPSGSIVVMAIHPAVLDANNTPIKDANGKWVRGDMALVTVMEKRTGWGAYHPMKRNGEWEYAVYNPEGTPQTPGLDCYGCHAKKAGLAKSFIFSDEDVKNPPDPALLLAPKGGDPENVSFQQNYSQEGSNYTLIKTYNKPDPDGDGEKVAEVRMVYANQTAIGSVTNGILDRGSVLVMDVFNAVLDDDGAPETDENDNYIPEDDPKLVVVMSKAEENGKYSPANRNGEWAYGAFNPADLGQSVINEDNPSDCFGCHLKDAGGKVDFIFSWSDLKAAAATAAN